MSPCPFPTTITITLNSKVYLIAISFLLVNVNQSGLVDLADLFAFQCPGK